jgi:hypothetical protein
MLQGTQKHEKPEFQPVEIALADFIEDIGDALLRRLPS